MEDDEGLGLSSGCFDSYNDDVYGHDGQQDDSDYSIARDPDEVQLSQSPSPDHVPDNDRESILMEDREPARHTSPGLSNSMFANYAEPATDMSHRPLAIRDTQPHLLRPNAARGGAFQSRFTPRNTPRQPIEARGRQLHRSTIEQSKSRRTDPARDGSAFFGSDRRTGGQDQRQYQRDNTGIKRPRDQSDSASVGRPAKRTGTGLGGLGDIGNIVELSHQVKPRKDVKVIKGGDGMTTNLTVSGPKPVAVCTTYGRGIVMETDASKKGLEAVKSATQFAAAVSPLGRAVNYIVPVQPMLTRKGTGSAGSRIRPPQGTPKQLFMAPPPETGGDLSRGRLEPRKVPCELCKSTYHRTGRCPWSQTRNGDVTTCPWHDKTPNTPEDRHVMGAPAEADPWGKMIGCKEFLSLNLAFQTDLEALVDLLIVTRKHEAPLRVKSPSHCFVRLGVFYAKRFCQGNMPSQISFVWPYLKHEALDNKDVLRELALGQRAKTLMPPGFLDDKTIEEIIQMLHESKIPPQVHDPNTNAHTAHKNAVPEPVTFLEDMYNPILLDSHQEPLGVHQNMTEPPIRQVDAEEHGASGFYDEGDTMAEDPPRPAAQESTVSDDMDLADNPGLRTNGEGDIIATRESIPPVLWEAMETVRSRGRWFLSSFVIDVMEDLEANIIHDDITLDCFRDFLLSDNEQIPEIKSACDVVNWYR